MVKFDEASMRARQAELKAEIAAIRAVTDPMRAERDRYSQETSAKLKSMDESIREAERPLFDLQNEAGIIAKALGGKSLNVIGR